MASDDFERELDRFEVDRLVKQLAAKRKGIPEPPAAPAPGRVPSAFVPFGSPTAVPAPSSPAASQLSQSQPSPQAQPSRQAAGASSATRATSAGRRWSTNRLFMPTFSTGQPRKSFAFASSLGAMHLPNLRAISLPALPRLAFPVLTEEQWAVITARMFVALGVVLSLAMPYWPYSNSHSWGLALYLFSVALVVITGIWGSKLTWDTRLARSHTVAIVTVIWGLLLATVAVLPHVGYGLG